MASDSGYVDYVAVLGLDPEFKPADARRVYRKKIKDLLIEISQVQVTEERRNRFLLAIAQLNAAFYILRDKDRCDKYLADRAQVMQIEEEWRAQADKTEASDKCRRQFDQALRDFLSVYMEELMLEAGRDYCRSRIEAIAATREIVLAGLRDAADVCSLPAASGAFYVLLKVAANMDSMHLVERLVREHRVAVMPGSTFGVTDHCALRVSYGPLDRDTAREGIGRLVCGLRAILKG